MFLELIAQFSTRRKWNGRNVHPPTRLSGTFGNVVSSVQRRQPAEYVLNELFTRVRIINSIILPSHMKVRDNTSNICSNFVNMVHCNSWNESGVPSILYTLLFDRFRRPIETIEETEKFNANPSTFNPQRQTEIHDGVYLRIRIHTYTHKNATLCITFIRFDILFGADTFNPLDCW